jgi:tetratricopeptide (TPR) repeat protein
MASPSRITPDRVVLAGALLAALAYIQDLRYDFILDDVPLILINETLRSWHNWKSMFLTNIFAAKSQALPVEITAVHYRPIYRLWQLMNARVFGFVIPWWHLTSLLLHLCVVFLVYVLGLKVLKNRWTAALAATLFAVHPIHAESVAYVTASTDLLVTLFSLVAFLAYFRYREEGASLASYIVSIVAAAMAMLSKETAVMFPFLLVAYELLRETPADVPQAKSRLRPLAWTLPFFAVVGAYVAVRSFLFGLNTGPGSGASRLAAFLDIPLVSIVYLRNLVWPFRLSFFYPSEWSSHWTFARGVAVAFALAAAAYLWRKFREQKPLRLQLVWAVILFAPAALGVYAFVREDWVHDRHMYLASVPICFIAAALLTHPKWPAKYAAIASIAVVAILLTALAVQVPRFSDDATIYESALKVAPRSFLAHSYYGEALWNYGRKDEAIREFKFVTELSPQSSTAHERYGAALAEIGRDDEAGAEYEAALRCVPSSPKFRAFLLSETAQLELKHSEFSAAAEHMSEAVKLAPDALNYHALLAQALSHEGQTQEAETEMRLEAGVRRQIAQEERASRN